MTDDFISIGKITSTFGLKGFLKVASSGDILASLKPKSKIYLKEGLSLRPREIFAIRRTKNTFILSLEGFNSIDEAEKLISSLIYFPKQESGQLLGKDEFFTHQLIGLCPYTESTSFSEFKLIEVLDNPIHPILVFSDSVNEILVPYINQFVGKVDLKENKIEILNWEEWVHAD